jgi:hypothetical protein
MIENLQDDIESVKVLLKTDPALSEEEGKQTIDLFEQEERKVLIETKNWGVYRIVKLKAVLRHHWREQIFLLGDNIWKDDRPSLYLTDKNRYLSVCGETWLGGPVYLPVLGVRKSYVDGVGYYRKKAVQGEVRRSEGTIPAIRNTFAEKFEQMYKVDPKRDSVLLWESGRFERISNSFGNKTLCIWSPEEISLEYLEIKGNVKILSQSAIRLGQDVKLDNCILVAPNISFQESFRGRTQMFARDSLAIAAHSHLHFPSVIYMKSKRKGTDLSIANGTSFAGEIVLENSGVNASATVKVGKDCKIEGLLYCNGTLEMEGDIAGSLYTNRFVLKTSSALYENHLLNNRMDVADLNENYVGVAWFQKPEKKQLIERLY